MQMFGAKQEIKEARHKTLADLQPQLSAKCGLSPTELSTAIGYALVEAGVEVLTKPLNASYAEKHANVPTRWLSNQRVHDGPRNWEGTHRMSDRHELERLIAGIDEEIRDARGDVKEAETVGDAEII